MTPITGSHTTRKEHFMQAEQAEREWQLYHHQQQQQQVAGSQFQAHPHGTAAPAAHQQHWQQQQQQQAGQKQVPNELSMKLGLGGAMPQHSTWTR